MRSKLKMFTAFILVLSACWMDQHAEATMLLKKNFDSLVQEADGVVLGTVEKVTSSYDANKEIFTFVTLADLDVISGDFAGENFTVRLKGGRIDGEILEIEGSPLFNTGEQVVVFIKGNGKQAVPIVGWTQGVLRVVSSKNDQTIEDYEGNRIVGIKGGKFQKEVHNVSETTFVDPKTGAIVSEDLHIYKSDGHETVISKMTTPKGMTSSGQPDDDDIPEEETSSQEVKNKASLTLGQLRNAIVLNAKTKVKENVFLESADIMDINTPANDDAILKGNEKRLTPSSPGPTEVEPFLPKHDKKKTAEQDSLPAQQ